MKKIFLILTLFFSLQNHCQVEDNDEFYLKKLKQYKGINNDSLLFYSKQLKKSKDLCNKNKGRISEALAYYNSNDYQKAEILSNNIIDSLKKYQTFCFKKIKIAHHGLV